jgi:hypothetical protein
MAKKITIKIKGHNVICRHNGLTEAELQTFIGKNMSYLQKSSSRRKLYRKTQVTLGLKDIVKRLGYIIRAVKTACSPGFQDIDRRQDTSRSLLKLPPKAKRYAR